MAGINYTPPPTAGTPPGGNINSVQFNGSGTFKGLDFVEADAAEEHLQLIADNTINTPAQGKIILYANSDDGDEPLTVINSWGKNFPLQYNIGHKVIGMAWPAGGASVGSAFAWSNFTTSVGTWSSAVPLAGKSWSAGQALPNFTKMNGASATALNSSAEVYVNTINRAAIIGSGPQAWGTKLIITFGLPTYKSDQRIFAGYANAAGALGANVDPSTYTNAIGIIKDQASGSFVFFVRGAGIGTSVNTGINPTLNGVYRATIFIPSAGGQCYLNFQEILVGSITNADYSNNTTMPVVGTSMFAHLLVNTGAATTNAVNVSLIQIYEEQL
jgi:hypothetical protein